MIKLIPMAGAGSRFKEAGYETPKPLIPVLGKPMVITATQMLPEAEKTVFIVRSDFPQTKEVCDEIKKNIGNSEFIEVDHTTEGQASTCLLAKNVINNDEELIIGACDNGANYSNEKFFKQKENCDAIIWTFRNNVTVTENPKAYGWVDTQGEKATKLSVKVPISDQPINDHAVVGTFWFKRGSDFVRLAEKMITENDRINNEFYVDQCMQHFIDEGLNVKVFEIDQYICWGTPNDLKTFEYWHDFFTSESYFQ